MGIGQIKSAIKQALAKGRMTPSKGPTPLLQLLQFRLLQIVGLKNIIGDHSEFSNSAREFHWDKP
ncbi:hypothetical protein CHH27_01990 [Labrenzia sp. VG12]|nr:hypothetical protein CHH27_01990 [Labrenzia sp. VG12]